MNQSLKKRSAFVIKSVMWSLLFYFILMLAFNWDDVSTRIRGKVAVTTANTPCYGQAPETTASEPLPVKISSQGAMFSNIYVLIHAISGM